MQGQCPRCLVRLELPTTGHYQCERCGSRFEAHLIEPRGPAPTVAMQGGAAPVVDLTGAVCATHPENGAAALCERCGDFMCSLCATWADGRQYCPRCFDLLYQRGALYIARRSFQWPTISLVTGIIGIAMVCNCFPISIPLAIVAIVSGINARREIARRPDLPGKGMAVAGISTGVLAIVGGVGYLALIVASAFMN